MDREQETEDTKVKNYTERELTANSSNEEDNSIIVDRNEKEGVPAEMVVSDDDDGEENSESIKATEEAPVEDAATPGLPGVDYLTTSRDSDVKINEVSVEPVSREDSVVFEINGNDDNGPPRLHLETPERENSPTEEECKVAAFAPADKKDTVYEEYLQLLQERDKASRHSRQLQMRLAEHYRNRAVGDGQPEEEMVSEQLREYKKCINTLSDLKQQLCAESAAAQQQAEELRLQSEEQLDEVENEWRAFLALKKDVAVKVLSRHMSKKAAQANVESTLTAEQLREDELIQLRLNQVKLRMKIGRLEEELREGEGHAKDPMQRQFEQLKAERLEEKRRMEKQREQSLKLQEKISSGLELLSNIREKLFRSQTEVQSKREQLAEVEAMVAREKDLLSRTKQACNRLQRDNVRLKEGRGLLGSRVLLQDFEDTVDASDHLEERLENLKGRRAEIVSGCGRWEKKLEPA